MQDDPFHKKVKELYLMLFEMATGNLTFRLEADSSDDDLAKLAQSLNNLAARFQLALLKSGYVVPHYSFQNSIQFIFVLDLDFTLKSFNPEVAAKFGYAPAELFAVAFATLLDTRSKERWQSLKNEIKANDHYHDTAPFVFVTAFQKVFPAFCTISRLLYTNYVFISSITTHLQEATELNKNAGPARKPDEAAVIQNLYEYILQNLEKPLPTLRELATLFRTNEFKLKEGFRHFFKTSIYQLYNEERLKRAYLLIQQTDFPLKAVALQCGFNDYVTFSKAFRKRFGVAPGEVQRGL